MINQVGMEILLLTDNETSALARIIESDLMNNGHNGESQEIDSGWIHSIRPGVRHVLSKYNLNYGKYGLALLPATSLTQKRINFDHLREKVNNPLVCYGAGIEKLISAYSSIDGLLDMPTLCSYVGVARKNYLAGVIEQATQKRKDYLKAITFGAIRDGN